MLPLLRMTGLRVMTDERMDGWIVDGWMRVLLD
jgi:hypothetical protein